MIYRILPKHKIKCGELAEGMSQPVEHEGAKAILDWKLNLLIDGQNP
ncbi:hypothetical protein [Paenibacillus pabuli]|nr:hypothetical protein [Paenibacillus pabuli]MEC0128413.1 hypothetical protein [Paenibacillus pabuli]